MTANVLTLLVTASLILLLGVPAIANARSWRATITPLASIIGSGFLIIGPVLDHAFGAHAPFAMAGLCLIAYLFGAAIRQNILDREDGPSDVPAIKGVETAASWALSFAYIISVCYYLNLFGAFAVRLTPAGGEDNARLVTTVLFLLILAVGWTRGFGALERLEQVSVTLKLAIIGGLLMGMSLHFADVATGDGLMYHSPNLGGWQAITLLFGLIVTVQGFETSRYLGDEYDSRMRIRSMRYAQWLSSAIYMAYILLMSYTFRPEDIKLEETAIIDMMAQVAPILPVLLIAAALSAQFSAAIADTGGCGGLVNELTRKRVSPRLSYALIAGLGIALTWTADIFAIISFASRAFAFYYALQALGAAVRAWTFRKSVLFTGFYGALALLGFAITLFGQAIE
ncbi:hypothetical protein [Ponticaulis profundi]|uniref:Uncharacterized protein n=1 Tax=Ponticaulis profundi TaxID=2665222 RepID=A0ABW1S5V3_9PROT